MIARYDSDTAGLNDPDTARMARERHRPVLVAVRDAREELIAGCGTTLLAVRTLDGLSCDLHEGELLFLTGSVASGARALLRAFHGHTTRLHVRRRVAQGVQIRRAAINASALEGIVAGWHDHPARAIDASATTPASSRRVVYLLRVRSPSQLCATSSHAANTDAIASWRHWAAALRVRGGAMVLACEGSASMQAADIRPRRVTKLGDTPVDVVRESMIDRLSYEPSRNRTREVGTRTGVRVLALAAGRIVRESDDAQALTDDSDAIRQPTACHRQSTAFPAP